MGTRYFDTYILLSIFENHNLKLFNIKYEYDIHKLFLKQQNMEHVTTIILN